MSTLSTQILASKRHFLLNGTSVSRRNGWFQTVVGQAKYKGSLEHLLLESHEGFKEGWGLSYELGTPLKRLSTDQTDHLSNKILNDRK